MTQKTKFKQTEIGMIPEYWEVIPFREILLENTRNGIYKPKEFHGRGIKIINMKELFSFDRIKNQDMQLVDLNDSEKERFLVKFGDLLFARRSLTDYGAGKCSLVEDGDKRTFESSMILARPDPTKSSSLFLFYLFSSKYGKDLMRSILRQVAVSGITGTDLMRLPLPYPPLLEQQSIASILSTLDSKIELSQQMNKTLEAIGQAIFKRWFVDFEFPNEEGKPYKSSGGEMVDSELGQIPKGWEVKELSEFIKFVKGRKPNEVFENQEEGLMPQILIGVLDGGTPTFSNTGNMVLSNETDILMVMDGASSGRTERGFSGVLGSTLAKIQVNGLNQDYVYHLLKGKEEDIKQNTTGTSIPHADKKKIEKFVIAVPPKEILESFKTYVNKILFKQILIRKENNNLSQIRDSLLPKLMSGKIRVHVGGLI